MIVIFKLPYINSYTLVVKELIRNQNGGEKDKNSRFHLKDNLKLSIEKMESPLSSANTQKCSFTMSRSH